MNRVRNSSAFGWLCRVAAIVIAFGAVLVLAQPVAACTGSPPFPPIWVKGDVCTDGEITIIFHDYFTFAANNATCSCALNLPSNIGQVTQVQLLKAGTNIPVSTFNFSANPAANFGGGLNWQGFSASAVAAAGGIPVDLAFTVVPTQFRCDEQRSLLSKAGLDAKNAGLEFSRTVAQALRDPDGGVVVGTGGADEEGNPNHHVSVQPAGPVEISFDNRPDGCLAEAQLPCAIDLKTGRLSESCYTTPGLSIGDAPADSNGDGWLEASVAVNLTDECARRACVVLDYGQDPRGLTVDIASAGNGAPRGKPVGAVSKAGLEILNNTMSAWGGEKVDPLAVYELALNNGVYKVCIGDDAVTFGQGAGRSMLPIGLDLFNSASPFASGEGFVIGLNPAASTTQEPGTGLRRAHITIE